MPVIRSFPVLFHHTFAENTEILILNWSMVQKMLGTAALENIDDCQQFVTVVCIKV